MMYYFIFYAELKIWNKLFEDSIPKNVQLKREKKNYTFSKITTD